MLNGVAEEWKDIRGCLHGWPDGTVDVSPRVD